MKVNEAVFYQSVRLPAPSNREVHRVNPQSSESAEVDIRLVKGCVIVSHKNWSEDCIVGMANVRYLKMDKDSFDPPITKSDKPILEPRAVIAAKMKDEQKAKKAKEPKAD